MYGVPCLFFSSKHTKAKNIFLSSPIQNILPLCNVIYFHSTSFFSSFLHFPFLHAPHSQPHLKNRLHEFYFSVRYIWRRRLCNNHNGAHMNDLFSPISGSLYVWHRKKARIFRFNQSGRILFPMLAAILRCLSLPLSVPRSHLFISVLSYLRTEIAGALNGCSCVLIRKLLNFKLKSVENHATPLRAVDTTSLISMNNLSCFYCIQRR